MKIKNVTAAQITSALWVVQEIYGDHIEFKDGITTSGKRVISHRVALKAATGEKGSRRSASGRRGPWACWHVFRDFYTALFDAAPDAFVETGLGREGVKYTAETFQDLFPETYYTNAGSEMSPACFGALCECKEYSYETIDVSDLKAGDVIEDCKYLGMVTYTWEVSAGIKVFFSKGDKFSKSDVFGAPQALKVRRINP